MNIRVLNGQNRRIAYTDRKNGYLELLGCMSAACPGGYFRGDKKYLTDFFLSMECPGGAAVTDLYRSNARWTDVRPDGFSVVFEHSALDISLLLDEQAFCLSLRDPDSDGLPSCSAGIGVVLAPDALPKSIVPAGTPGSPAAQSAAASSVPAVGTPSDASESPGAAAVAIPAGPGQWIRYSSGGITFWQNESGVAVSSASPFRVETAGSDRIILYGEGEAAPFYLVFARDGQEARAQAIALARSAAIHGHRAKIGEFLAGCESDSGDAEFDEAVKWAQFSGWLLVTDDPGRGIWAGLPWFRDNWGRDTFIALSGILLVSGRFAEAREVLVGFARHQNRDPESGDYGRIPNRYRGDHDVIFNTADGTLWFIRALWEYVQYSGDTAILAELRDTVDLALEADMTRRTDAHGFLLHGDADTWMDARIRGADPWSPRGDRACDIQALWYTALRIGVHIARFLGDDAKSAERTELAARVKLSFRRFFWCDDRRALADRLPPGGHGEWLRDFRVRPNQLFAITVPSILGGESEEDQLLDAASRLQVLDNVRRELVSPFGLFSLCPDDPLFHPRHEHPDWYHKDAAYHNGTIWVWNTGPYVSASVAGAVPSSSSTLPCISEALLRNEARMVTGMGCVGSLSENIFAEPDSEGNPVLSGTFSQAWSVSEFARNVWQDVIGFRPCLAENRIVIHPHLPAGTDRWTARPIFGPNWSLSIELERRTACGTTGIHCRLVWHAGGNPPAADLSVNGVALHPGQPVELFFTLTSGQGIMPAEAVRTERSCTDSLRVGLSGAVPWVPEEVSWQADLFPKHAFAPEWCGAVHRKDYLEQLILGGRMNSPNGGGPNAAALEWFFDSDQFHRTFHTRLPLGALWSPRSTLFRLWAPTARSVELVLYPDGADSPPSRIVPLAAGSEAAGSAGVWEVSLPGDLHGAYYRYRVRAHGIIRESADPYARTCGVNGLRSMVCDFSRTDPERWDSVRAPELSSPNDAVVYEVHVADISSSPSWNGDERLRRTFLGASAPGASCRGVPAGFDHIRSLGVTHVQLLPVFDFSSVDEKRSRDSAYGDQLVFGKFNWGYDPGNYSSPEGSYSSDPFDGATRVRELKTLVRDYAAAGIGVIMDVVYNHVPAAQYHALGVCVPGYYFRVDSYSGAGDDTASERAMYRRYMVDSLSWWLAEYKLCGFRFDLMGLHDVETMNAIREALTGLKADVLLYGEGWDMYRAGKMVSASMKEARKMPGIGFFNDAFRCGIKGTVFGASEGGFIHDGSHREAVKFGLVGATFHPQVHNREVDGTANPNPWTGLTASSVNYTEIHDNSTLYDKLVLVEPRADEMHYERLQKTALGLVILAQGQPVLHAGMEFMRTKEIPADLLASHHSLHDLYWTADRTRAFSHNTYNLSDRINALDWNRCADKRGVVDYVRGLIAVRRSHPLFRLRTEEEVASALSFLEPDPHSDVPMVLPDPELVPPDSPATEMHAARHHPVGGNPPLLAWKISGEGTGDSWRSACVIVNPASAAVPFRLPGCAEGFSWRLVTDGEWFMPGAIPSAGVKTAGAGVPSMEPSFADPAPGTVVTIAPKALYLYAEF